MRPRCSTCLLLTAGVADGGIRVGDPAGRGGGTPHSRRGAGGGPDRSFRHRVSRALPQLRIDRSRSARGLRIDQRNARRAAACGHEPAAIRRRGRRHRTGERDRDRLGRGHREEPGCRSAEPVGADGGRRRANPWCCCGRIRRPANPSACPARFSRMPTAEWFSKPPQGIEALRCSGLAESFSFTAPPDLAAVPTLVGAGAQSPPRDAHGDVVLPRPRLRLGGKLYRDVVGRRQDDGSRRLGHARQRQWRRIPGGPRAGGRGQGEPRERRRPADRCRRPHLGALLAARLDQRSGRLPAIRARGPLGRRAAQSHNADGGDGGAEPGHGCGAPVWSRSSSAI